VKKVKGIGLWAVTLTIATFLITCDKEQECGCEGKKLFNLTNELGQIYYETEGDYATFVSAALGTNFVLCNPAEFRDTLATFEQGDLVYASGKAHRQCYNNPYAPVSYHLTMERIMEYKLDD
jgi:hypothetical protein